MRTREGRAALRCVSPLEQEVLHAEDRRDGISDLVRQPRRQATDAGQLLASNELSPRFTQPRRGLRELHDLRAHRVFFVHESLRHRLHADGELRQLAGAGGRDHEEARPAGDAIGGADQRFHRLHDEAREREVREREEREREREHVERDQPHQR